MEQVDIALVVALDEEYQTFRRTLGLDPQRSAERMHHFVMGDRGSRPVSMVVYVTGEMGLNQATSATDLLLTKFAPKWLVSIGLSGHLESDCALGDVVAATAVDLPYNEARASADGLKLAGREFEVGGLKKFLAAVDPTKFLQGRELQLPTAAKQGLEERHLWRKYPRLHRGPICSTDFLVDDPKEKAKLLERNRRFLCTDMEAAAVVMAARRVDFEGKLVVIRGISDPADGTKKLIDTLAGGGVFRHYAMQNATTVLYHAVLKPLMAKEGTPPYSDRPLITESIERLRVITDRLKNTPSREDFVTAVDSDANCWATDTDLAKYVYRARISRLYSEVPKPLAKEIANHSGGRVLDFYVALHVMRSLDTKFESNPELLTPLTHVHTYEVNQYCKALMVSAKNRNQLAGLLGRIGVAYDSAASSSLEPATKSNLQAHLCYLLGRVTDTQYWRRAVQTLQLWRDRLVTLAPEKRKSAAKKRALGVPVAALERLQKEHILQYRTIQISLTQLGVEGESDKYILSCLASPALDAQNRGFHLEYYGDTPYDPAQPLSNEDRLQPIPKTLHALGDKLLRAFRLKENYPLRDIDLYTIISLLRSRLQKGVLNEHDRDRGLQVLSQASWFSTNKNLPMLLDRIRADVGNQKFHPLEMVDELYRLKKIPRTGWSARGRSVEKPESIGSHTFGGLMLIELFLPETTSAEGKKMGRMYSKEKVLRLFLKHDWAEAIIGDLLPDQKNEESVVLKEDTAVRHLSSVFIYAPYANKTIYEDWVSFEKGEHINSRLARDVDQLDNLHQLILESKEKPQAIPDRQTWIDYIRMKIQTDWGARMFSYLLSRE